MSTHPTFHPNISTNLSEGLRDEINGVAKVFSESGVKSENKPDKVINTNFPKYNLIFGSDNHILTDDKNYTYKLGIEVKPFAYSTGAFLFGGANFQKSLDSKPQNDRFNAEAGVGYMWGKTGLGASYSYESALPKNNFDFKNFERIGNNNEFSLVLSHLGVNHSHKNVYNNSYLKFSTGLSSDFSNIKSYGLEFGLPQMPLFGIGNLQLGAYYNHLMEDVSKQDKSPIDTFGIYSNFNLPILTPKKAKEL